MPGRPTLYHFSEDPTITVFEPRTPAHRPEVQPLVWAIDEWHAPMYFFPRDCPRILLWCLPTTSDEDRARWFGATAARMIAYLEYDWLERMRSTPLYRYTLPPEGFESLDDAGMHVCRAAVEPLAVAPVGDLIAALRAADVEVRLMERLTPLRAVWDTTLHASGIRLRNARGWDYVASPPPPSRAGVAPPTLPPGTEAHMSAPAHEPLDVLEALHSTPARRYLKPDPIPDDVLWAILDAAIRAPSGGNTQGWGWVVVTDAATKQQIAEWYREGWERAYGSRREQILGEGAAGDALGRRNFLSAEHLAQHLEEAPVWVMPVLRGAARAQNARAGSSIYGAVQHLMLAARAYGIGATLTTLYAGHEDDVKALLGIPEDALTMALIPLGYPARGRWAEPKRRPVEEVAHWGRWGERRERGQS